MQERLQNGKYVQTHRKVHVRLQKRFKEMQNKLQACREPVHLACKKVRRPWRAARTAAWWRERVYAAESGLCAPVKLAVAREGREGAVAVSQ